MLNASTKGAVVAQLDSVLSQYDELRRAAPHDDLSGVPESGHHKIIAHGRAAIERIAGPGSAYARQAAAILESLNTGWIGDKVVAIAGVVASLRDDIQAGYLDTLAALLHAEVFGDLLEAAEHLLGEHYKDPAAVLIGGALEAHLRRLCDYHGIPLTVTTAAGDKLKKADQMNADLASAQVYSKLDQKSVTAWLGLRNQAAHGHFAEYTAEQVALLLAGVRDFLIRNPA